MAPVILNGASNLAIIWRQAMFHMIAGMCLSASEDPNPLPSGLS